MTSSKPSNKSKPNTSIPTEMLQHLEYLRGLHLDGPKLGNTYLEDTALQQYTHHILANNSLFCQHLTKMGDRLSTVYLSASRNAEENQPRLQQFDSYGRRIDKLHLSEGWQLQKQYAAEDGIVSLAYEDDKFGLGKWQRFGQLVNLYMYHPSSGLFGCPLAMTDGAAYTIKHILQNQKPNPQTRALLEDAFKHLISRTDSWTSGQWMTQKKGGSDVSNTETIAIQQQGNSFRLYGYKWFTSATDSHMTLGLAKILPKGVQPTVENLKSIKVSLFFVKLRNQDGSLNNMQIIRLKDKLGTRQLPTAQILLKGSFAHLISEPEQGVKLISKMLTITRIYNSATAVGVIRRGLALARDYASRRIIGKTPLSQMPLQLRVLSHLEVVHRGNLMLYLRMSQLFSKEHHKSITPHEANILRVMVPLMKLFTAKQSLSVLTQVLQSFGGMGYIEGSMLPSLLRDAQVLSIWQGTTNVLCYDFVRALLKKQNKFMPIQSLTYYFTQTFQHIKEIDIDNARITTINKKIILAYTDLFRDINEALKTGFKSHMSELRTFCFGLTRLFIATQLSSHLLTTLRDRDIEILQRWIDIGLYFRQKYSKKSDKQLGMDLNDVGVSSSVGDYDRRGMIRSKL